MEKKLYKFDFAKRICECEVVKETAKTYKYRFTNETSIWTVYKIDVDAMEDDARKLIASSKQSLIDLAIKSVDYQIRNHQIKIKRLQEEKQNYNKIQY